MIGYRIAIKKFFQWLEYHNKRDYKWKYKKYPLKAEFIETTIMKPNHINKKKRKGDILVPDDIKKLVSVAKNQRNKAMVWVLFDAGLRASELLMMNYNDVSFDKDDYCWISVTGKTGPRDVLLVPSTIHLRRWLEQHPTKERNSPLWCNIASNSKNERLSYRHLAKNLFKLKEKAKLDKPINPHWFRHSSCTLYAQNLTEAQMCEKYGWIQGSKMPRTYVLMSGKHTKEAILRMYGKSTREDNKKLVDIIKCIRCNHINPPEVDYCEKCHFALTQEALLKIKEQRESEQKELIKLIVESGLIDKLIDQRVKELQN
jgi:integrase